MLIERGTLIGGRLVDDRRKARKIGFMPGGLWNHIDVALANEIFRKSFSSEDAKKQDPFGDETLSALVYDVFELLHQFDAHQCGDISTVEWIKAKDLFLKKAAEYTKE